MTDDHRALIEQARREHHPFELDGQTFCYGCTVGSDDGHMENDSGPYPCLTARLADALEGAERERDELRGHYDAVRDQVIVVTQRLAAARKALDEIAGTATQWVDTPHAGRLLRQIEQEARAALEALRGAGDRA